jgi:hypothetical protein
MVQVHHPVKSAFTTPDLLSCQISAARPFSPCFWKFFSAGALSHGRDSDMTEIDLDMERHRQFHHAGEDVAVAVAASRRVKNIRIDEG